MLYAFLISLVCTICSVHIIIIDYLVIIIFGEEYKLQGILNFINAISKDKHEGCTRTEAAICAF
jgi:hypothetical protein